MSHIAQNPDLLLDMPVNLFAAAPQNDFFVFKRWSEAAYEPMFGGSVASHPAIGAGDRQRASRL